jgi:hypothetical protein
MKLPKPVIRFLLGAFLVVAVIGLGFAWAASATRTWGSTGEEIARSLPGDERIPNPTLVWNHALTIRAPAAAVYPWLVQIGDSRGAFYSITFIENAFCLAGGGCYYVNANRVHPEWQNPEKGAQGIIMDFMVISDYEPGQYVLAAASDNLPFRWTWLWYVQPVDANTSRLIVRHRVAFPPDTPRAVIDLIFTTGFVMERAMMLGIQTRAEGFIPAPVEEPIGAAVWLAVFGLGVVCAVRFVRRTDDYAALGVGLGAVIALFMLTYVQPPLGWRLVLFLAVAAGLSSAIWLSHARSRPT